MMNTSFLFFFFSNYTVSTLDYYRKMHRSEAVSADREEEDSDSGSGGMYHRTAAGGAAASRPAGRLLPTSKRSI